MKETKKEEKRGRRCFWFLKSKPAMNKEAGNKMLLPASL